MTTIGFSTSTTTEEDRRTVPTDEGDHERFSHYVEKDKLTEAMVMGTPVVALCGKVWVPSRAPETRQTYPPLNAPSADVGRSHVTRAVPESWFSAATMLAP